ncbi:hypothetical protein GCM10027569_03990 [Flindersiella endophytica]
MRREREDGLDTIDWMTRQPWFGDSMILIGMSYLGYVQWAGRGRRAATGEGDDPGGDRIVTRARVPPSG